MFSARSMRNLVPPGWWPKLRHFLGSLGCLMLAVILIFWAVNLLITLPSGPFLEIFRIVCAVIASFILAGWCVSQIHRQPALQRATRPTRSLYHDFASVNEDFKSAFDASLNQHRAGGEADLFALFDTLLEHYSNWDRSSLLDLLERHPNAQSAHEIIRRAAIFLTLGRGAEAEQELKKAISLHPSNPAFLLALADLSFTRSNFTYATDLFYKALSDFHFDSRVRTWIFAAELVSRRAAGELPLLRHRFEDFLRSKPSATEQLVLLHHLTRPHYEALQPEVAQYILQVTERAIRLFPRHPVFKLHKAALLFEMGDRAAAKENLFKCAFESGLQDLFCFYLARIERKRGHLDRARQLARQVLKFSPDRLLLDRLRLEFGLAR